MEEEESEDELVDTQAHGGGRVWNTTTYKRDRAPDQYELARDTENLFFHTQVQEDAFYGHLVHKVVFKHQRIDWYYMAEYDVMSGLVPRFETLGLRDFLEHKCDWNDTVIRQFYATVEVDMINETLFWMTGKRRYEATFREFATVNELDYDFIITHSHDITDEATLGINDIIRFYEPTRTEIHRVFEKSIGLRHHPAVILKIARTTILPKSGFKDGFVGWHRNFVKHVMDNERMDVVALIMYELLEKKTDFESNIYYAPYIMSLILEKTKFKGHCDVKHTLYRPYKNIPDFINRPLTPFLEGDLQGGVEAPAAPHSQGDGAQAPHHDAHAMPPPPPPPLQPQWAPPPGYFDPYFASMQQSMNTQFQQMQMGFENHFEAYGQQMLNHFESMQHGFQQQLDARFTSFGQHIHDTMYQPMMNRLQHVNTSLHADIDALNDRFDDLTTTDEYHELAHQQQQLQTDFRSFTDHFHSYFPAPTPPPQFYPHQPYYPQPPPGEPPQDD